ncbi:MAG: penicillin-binding protein 2 [Kiritimatiellae bacterium]|nr:penicillin-binding protein 2 [Kiritimatiellia bacterium]
MTARDRDIRVFFPWRILGLGLAMLCALGLLATRLWTLQMEQEDIHLRRLAKQSLRSVRTPGTRGRILDRRGSRLADNRMSFCLELYPEELRKPGARQRTVDAVCETLDRLAEVMDTNRTVSAAAVRTHLNRRTPLPLVAWRDLGREQVARFAERSDEFPGVELRVEPVREYPRTLAAGGATNGLAAHLLGYVGRADDEALAREEASGEEDRPPESFHYYLPEMVGRAGLEKRLDEHLRAATGGRLEYQVDVAGFRYRTLEETCREPGRGADVTLALDAGIQRFAEEALAGRRGAVVVVDATNGDVLAMASAPTFNPNDFIPAITRAQWQSLQGPDRPLFNRAAMGEYPPGSTFKPVTLLAAMKSGKVRPDTVYNCPGAFELGNARFRCWQSWGHGAIDLAHAVRYSCNVYLFHAGLACGAEAIQEMARACGFGVRTGADLDAERPGLVPDAIWKRLARRDGWRDGDTCNMSIGQGAVLVTPLQLAMYAAALANGGTLWWPRVVLSRRDASAAGRAAVTDIPARKSPSPGPQIDKPLLDTVRRGMRDVVNSSDGSGRRAKIPGFTLAAKTGTAEYGAKGSGKKMTWMIAFGPYENPRYAAAFLIEDGDSGGSTVSPRVGEFFQKLLALEACRAAKDAAKKAPPPPPPGNVAVLLRVRRDPPPRLQSTAIDCNRLQPPLSSLVSRLSSLSSLPEVPA